MFFPLGHAALFSIAIWLGTGDSIHLSCAATARAATLLERSERFQPRVSRPHSAHSKNMRPDARWIRSSCPSIRHLSDNLRIFVPPTYTPCPTTAASAASSSLSALTISHPSTTMSSRITAPPFDPHERKMTADLVRAATLSSAVHGVSGRERGDVPGASIHDAPLEVLS